MLILIGVVAFIGVLGIAALGRSRRFNEVDRFHRASRMTTEWARAGVTRPTIGAQESPHDERQGAEARDT